MIIIVKFIPAVQCIDCFSPPRQKPETH